MAEPELKHDVLEHIDALRAMLLKIIGTYIVFCIPGWFLASPLLDYLLEHAVPGGFTIHYFTLLEPFFVMIKLTLTLAAAIVIYAVTFRFRWSGGIEAYTLWGYAFISLVLLVTMKVKIHNGILEWTGRHILGIYILQRLPMTVLDHMGCVAAHKYLSLAAAMAITFVMAALFHRFTDRLIAAMTGARRAQATTEK